MLATEMLRMDLCGHRIVQPPTVGNECLLVMFNQFSNE